MPKPFVAAGGISIRMLTVESQGGASLGQVIRLKELTLRHAPNEQAKAHLTLQVTAEDGAKFIKQVTGDVKIKIQASDGNNKAVIFLGCILEAGLENRADMTLLRLELADTSYLQDIKRQSQSFQNSKKTYQDILKTAFGGEGTVKLANGLNQAIEKMVLQYEETNWQFAARMASRFNAPLVTDLTADKCNLSLGLSGGGGETELTTSKVEAYVDSDTFERVSKNNWLKKQAATKEDFTGLRVESYDYAYLGDKIKVNGTAYFVRKVVARLTEGLLKMTYDLATKETGFLAPAVKHPRLAGLILTGQVKEVKKDKVRIFLPDIDKSFDGSSDTWLPYATAYSSRDGSGWYVMPEVDDYVRVLFPNGDEADAYVSSAINMTPTEEVKNKSFKAPGGKELLLTDKGVEIICEHQKIFVKLEQGKGISLVSSKNINVSADGDISLESKGAVQILAKKSIDLQAGSSHLKVLSNQVAIGGQSIKLGE